MSNSIEMNDSGVIPYVEFEASNSAYDRRIREFKIVNNGFKNIEEFLIAAFEIYQVEITKAVAEFNLIKTVSYFTAEFERSFHIDELSDVLSEKREIHIPSKNHEISSTSDLRDHFRNDIINSVVQKVDEAMVEGSGFTLSTINHLLVQIFKYEPLRGSGNNIELPKKLKNKRSIVNLINTHDECFKWSILAALHYEEVYVKNRHKVNDAASYRFWANELNFNGIDFPVKLNQIEKFMQQNNQLAVNVYYFDTEKNCVCPRYLSLKPVGTQYIHLLMITEATPEHSNEAHGVSSHYCWIKNLSALVGSQMSKHKSKKLICDRCLNHFNSHEKLEKHKKSCENINECAIEMPLFGENYEFFKNYKNQLKIPFIVYADTEAILKTPETQVFNINCSTQAHHQHEVHSIGYYFKCENKEMESYYASYRGVECVDWFLSELKKIATNVCNFLTRNKTMNVLSDEEEKAFKEATTCHICKKKFSIDSHIRVKDHCHISGNYRGAAHQSCNLQYQISRTIPVVMHNLSGYDSHLIIKKLATSKKINGEISIIPLNSEKYISFIKTVHGLGFPNQNQIKIKFIDSLRFMTASLDSLASLIPPEKKSILKAECIKSGFCSEELFNLLIRKGVFPYEYIDCYEKLEESTLPPKKCFYSMLNGSDISDEDYIHARNVWTKFGIRTLGEYSDLYLKTDVLLLADVFENFRNTCHATHSLDPAHYFGAPGLSFDAMMKYTGCSIELFTDVDMLLFAESGIRGGVSQVNKRYVRANNQYMDDEFDSSKETSYLLYLDGKYALIS